MKVGSKKINYLYVAYSHDKLMLPVAVYDSVVELARFLDRTPVSVASAISQGNPYLAKIYVGDED